MPKFSIRHMNFVRLVRYYHILENRNQFDDLELRARVLINDQK